MNTVDDRYRAAEAISPRPLLRGIPEKVRPEHSAVIVIDMQNDFLAEGGLMHREGADLALAQACSTRISRLLTAARSVGLSIVFVRNIYSSDKNLYLSDVWLEQAARRRPGGYTLFPACEEASWGGDFYQDIKPKPGEPVVTKHRYGGFWNTDLDTILRARGIRTMIFTGVSTSCCVETTAREAFMRDYYVVVVEDATATYTQASHDAALRRLDALFGEVTSTDRLCEIWGGAAS